MKIAVIAASKNPLSVYGKSILEKSLQSLAEQTYENWHLYLVNYGDLGESQEIAKILPIKKVTILNLEETEGNQFTEALNLGLKTATEEFIARHDLDDWSKPERFEKQIKFFEENPEVSLVGTMAEICGLDNRISQLKKPIPIWNHLDILRKVRACNPFVHGSVMFRRELVLDKVGYYDPSYSTAQDFDYWCRIMAESPVANLEEYLYVWRDVKSSISRKNPGAGPKNKGIAITKWGRKLNRKLKELEK